MKVGHVRSLVTALADITGNAPETPQVLSVLECILGVHAMEGELNRQRPLFFTPSTIPVQLHLGVVHSLLGQYINELQYNTRVSVLY